MTINDLVAGLGNQQFNKDVEDEANSYFKRIFNTASSQPGVAPLTVDELLELMRKFKHSPNSRENVRIIINGFSFTGSYLFLFDITMDWDQLLDYSLFLKLILLNVICRKFTVA